LNKELIINAAPQAVEIALLEDKKLVEMHNENANASFGVGDLYLGKVKKLIPGLNAAFIDVGFEKDAFLHYSDLSPYIRSILKFTKLAMNDTSPEGLNFENFQVEPEIVKTGKIAEVLSGKPNILVQILKEPIAAKGPRLSCEISLPGRNVVLTPFNDIIAVSRKIHSSEERKRLQKIIEAVKPKNFGVIVRTAAEGKPAAELHDDLLGLIATWKNIQHNLKGAVPPTKILAEEGKTNSILRDLLTEDFNKIVVNDKNIYNDTKAYLHRIAPGKLDILSFHNNGSPVFDAYGVTRQVKASFGKTVNLPSGAYLIIEHTEALHVIDVNSGYKSVGNNQEQNALETNLEAAEEVVQQLKLRNIGGLIVIDFIDMAIAANRQKVFSFFEKILKERDKFQSVVLKISEFGLVQMTRKRSGKTLVQQLTTDCPTCHGSGFIKSYQTESYAILRAIRDELKTISAQKIEIQVNSHIFNYLTSTEYDAILKLENIFKLKITLLSNKDLATDKYKIEKKQ